MTVECPCVTGDTVQVSVLVRSESDPNSETLFRHSFTSKGSGDTVFLIDLLLRHVFFFLYNYILRIHDVPYELVSIM